MLVYDMFCGVGGFSSGAMQAGCAIGKGVDLDPVVLRSFQENTGAEVECLDIFSPGFVWPQVHDNLHMHFSPECQQLSCANAHADEESGLVGMRFCLGVVLRQRYRSWSVENVSTPATRALAASYAATHPGEIDHASVDAADYGSPSSRVRLIIGPPAAIMQLRLAVGPVRSLSQAFLERGLVPVSKFVKNNSIKRDGSACVRSTYHPCHTALASTPLRWCDVDGATVRCFSVSETAVALGIPAGWKLPKGQRRGIRALGNAVPTHLSKAIMEASMRAVRHAGKAA